MSPAKISLLTKQKLTNQQPISVANQTLFFPMSKTVCDVVFFPTRSTDTYKNIYIKKITAEITNLKPNRPKRTTTNQSTKITTTTHLHPSVWAGLCWRFTSNPDWHKIIRLGSNRRSRSPRQVRRQANFHIFFSSSSFPHSLWIKMINFCSFFSSSEISSIFSHFTSPSFLCHFADFPLRLIDLYRTVSWN